MTIEKEAKDIWNRLCGYRTAKKEKPYLLISAALQKKQDRIDELEKKLANYNAITKPTMFFSEGEVVSSSPVFLNKEFVCRYCERVTYYAWRPSSYEDFEMGGKSCEYRVKKLESALRNCLSTLQLCYSKKDYMPFSIQYVTKSIELAKKVIGGGNE